MTAHTLIAVDPATLDQILERLDQIHAHLDQLAPAREWLTVPEYADHHGVAVRTVQNWIAAGRVEAKGRGRTRKVRL